MKSRQLGPFNVAEPSRRDRLVADLLRAVEDVLRSRNGWVLSDRTVRAIGEHFNDILECQPSQPRIELSAHDAYLGIPVVRDPTLEPGMVEIRSGRGWFRFKAADAGIVLPDSSPADEAESAQRREPVAAAPGCHLRGEAEMARKITLDDNERAGLLALREVDPEAARWIAPWSGMDLAKHGADPVSASYEGRKTVFRRLAQRKLVDAEPDAHAAPRGYSLNDKGREALAQIDAEARARADWRVSAVREVFNDRRVTVTYVPDSPWITIDVEPLWNAEVTDENAGRSFAIWVTTGALYRVGQNGAVEDDPVPEGANPRELGRI